MDSPSNARALVHEQAARRAVSSGNDAIALQELDRSLALDSSSSRAYAMRGDVHFRLGDRTRALSDYDAAIALGGDDEHVRFHRGRLNFERGELEAARVDFEAVVRSNASSAQGHRHLAAVLAHTGHVLDALAEYTRAIELGGAHGSEARFERGLMHYALERYVEAAADFRSSPSAGLRSALYAWAAQLHSGDGEAADRELAAARTRKWRDGERDLSRALAAFVMGEIDAATLRRRAADASKSADERDEALCDSELFIALRCRAAGDEDSYRSALARSTAKPLFRSFAHWCAEVESEVELRAEHERAR